VLDAILEDYIEDNKAPGVIAASHGYDVDLVRKVARMVTEANISGSKRRRAENFREGVWFGRRYPSLPTGDVGKAAICT